MNKIPVLKICWLILLFVAFNIVAQAQTKRAVFDTPESILWSDSVFRTLSYDQKIGQLFMVDAYSNRDSVHVNYIRSLICDYHIGGIIFFQGGPMRQAKLTNYYQALAPVPLMVGIDGEWGLSMRLDSTIRFPRQMTLGAAGSDTNVYEMASEIGRQCRRMGIHINFAPVADINNNPLNPVINSRSFGEDKKKVTSFAVAYSNGLQDNHVLACGKHFPGHGNTDADSHFSLPVINEPESTLDTVELFPFTNLIENDVASIMVAHLYIPSLDSTPNLASTLSPKIVNGLLRRKMGYQGLVFTDAMNMKGVADYYPPGEHELLALLAGNDVLLYSIDVPKSFMRIHYAIQNCEISQELIDEKVKRLLKAKYWAGLNEKPYISTEGLIEDLNPPNAIEKNRSFYEQSVTLLKNREELLPLKFISRGKVASIVINDTIANPFQLMMLNYAPVDIFRMDSKVTNAVFDSLAKTLERYENVVLSIHNTSTRAASGYGVSDQATQLFSYLNERTNLVTVVFGNAYCLSRFPGIENADALILGYEDTGWPLFYTAQAIFGAAHMTGKLPVSPVAGFNAGDGIPFNENYERLRYSYPAEAGIHSYLLDRIDTLVLKAIAEKAIPGCQVLAAKDGKIIYQKSFGTFTYDSTSSKVTNTDLYDIASVTKIAATALALMKLEEEGKIDIEKKASKYLPSLRKTNKKDLIISDILTHQAGLKSWIPFWKKTKSADSTAFYSRIPSEDFSIRISDSLYLTTTYKDSIWDEILDSPVEHAGTYVYSDIGMLIMQKMIEKITGQTLTEYVNEKFYQPLGLHRLMFNPVGKTDTSRVVPTELDTAFRHVLIKGYVHDPAAAMLGGEAGNAGLFSDANSLAIIMQMLLNGGTYGGSRYLNRETIEKFTATHYFKEGKNRRGLVFDKPEPDKTKSGPTAVSAPMSVFGHSGFTGTCAWADPDNKLVYIFLSNRVYPDASNNKLSKMNYRTDIMQVLYDAIAPPAP